MAEAGVHGEHGAPGSDPEIARSATDRARSDIDRRQLGVLTLGHFSVDYAMGVVPALLPFLVAERGYSLGQASTLVLAVVASSSIVQPVFGRLGDLRPMPWLLPISLIVSGLGVAAIGFVSSYAAVLGVAVLAGLGIAAYHPDSTRYVSFVSGSHRSTGMSVFAVGGNLGFAFAPIVVTPVVLLFGLEGTAALLALPFAAAVAILISYRSLRAAEPPESRQPALSRTGSDEWGAFARLNGSNVLRFMVFYGMVTFVPLYFVLELGASEALGNTALTVMVVGGAISTLVTGRLADRFPRRSVLWISIVPLTPLLLLFLLGGPAVAIALCALIGATTIGTIAVSLVMSQEYLPNHMGLASGMAIGLALGLGGVGAGLLGFLADATGIPTVIALMAILPLPALALVLSLPRADRPRPAPEPVGASSLG